MPKPFEIRDEDDLQRFRGRKNRNVYILFTKVSTPPQNELTGPPDLGVALRMEPRRTRARIPFDRFGRWACRSRRCGTPRTARSSISLERHALPGVSDTGSQILEMPG